MAERRLGTGLEALLGPPPPTAAPGAAAREIPLDQIRPNPFQPRTDFDETALQALATSIRRHGLLQPIALRQDPAGYEIVYGERRWRAARLAGLLAIPAVVRPANDHEMLLYALAENVQREDLNPIEKARALKQLLETAECSHERVGDELGYDRSTVTNYLRLLDLPVEIQDLVSRGTLSMGHARVLVGVADRSAQFMLLARIVREDLSVRAAEEASRNLAPKRNGAKSNGKAASNGATELEQRLGDYFGTRVAVKAAGKGGRIVIEYHDAEHLTSILGRLGLL